MILYEGCLTTDVRAGLLEVLYSLSGCHIFTKKELRQHCGVALEMLDNAQRYGSSNMVRFEWNRSRDGIEIKIVNLASKKDAEKMVDVVKRVREMEQSELKKALMQQLMEGGFGDKGGAGLGILQIATRAGNNLDARIEKADENNYLCESTFKTKRA